MANGSYDNLYGKYGTRAKPKRGRLARPQAKMGFINNIKGVMTNPSGFFESVRNEDDVMPAFRYTGLFVLILMVPSLILAVYATPIPVLGLLNLWTALLLGTALLTYYVLYMVMTFAGAGMMHVITKTFKGKGNYIATYNAMTYSLTPYFLSAWIISVIITFLSPGVWIKVALWLIVFVPVLYLQTIGLSKLHDISKLRAFLIIMFPIIVVAIIGALAYVYVSSLLPMFSGSVLS